MPVFEALEQIGITMNLDNFYQKYGHPITLDNSIESKRYQEFVNYHLGILSQVLNTKCKQSKIDLKVINNFDLNAHAFKYDDKKYLLAFRTGIWIVIDRLSSQYTNLFEKNLKLIGSLSKQIEYKHLFEYFVLLFLFGHEAGHVFRGHTDFSERKLIDESEIMKFNAYNKLSYRFSSDEKKLKFLFEADADAFSGFIVASGIYQQYKNLLKLFPSTKNDDLSIELYKMASYSILILMNVFNHSYHPSIAYYAPMLRFGIVLGHLSEQLLKYELFSEANLFKLNMETFFECYSFFMDNGNNFNKISSNDLQQEIQKNWEIHKEFSLEIEKYKIC